MTWRGVWFSVALGLLSGVTPIPGVNDARAEGWHPRSAFEPHRGWQDQRPSRPSPYWGWLDRSNPWPEGGRWGERNHRPRSESWDGPGRGPRLSSEERRRLEALDQRFRAELRRSLADGHIGRGERERLAELREWRDRLAWSYGRDSDRRW